MIIRYTAKSKEEIESAFEWYNNQRKGLGYEFLDCLEASLHKIGKYPEMYEICYSNFRRCVVRKFPFSIFYTIEETEIAIHSVFDNRQDPQKRP